jgi:hypothetical protein
VFSSECEDLRDLGDREAHHSPLSREGERNSALPRRSSLAAALPVSRARVVPLRFPGFPSSGLARRGTESDKAIPGTRARVVIGALTAG